MMPTVTGTHQCLVPAYHLYKAAFRPSKGPSPQCYRDAAGLGQARLENSSLPQLSRREIAARLHALPSDFLSSPTLDKVLPLPDIEAVVSILGSGPGAVYLVGTGPGDPYLLTLRAVQLMQTADVVLYDRLISAEILRLIHPGARMVYVGKQAGLHTRTQEEIHALLCQFASEGSTVLRLKGGDPFIFGRGGEEAQYLQERGIAVYTVPGITAASGISACLGIPLTHRGLATSVRFLTGHSRDGGEEALDASTTALVDENTTLVVYMGLQTLPKLVGQLRAAGLGMRTPAVAVERGTTPEQRTVFAPLEELAERVVKAQLKSPTLIVIGQVVALAPEWDHARTAVVDSLQSLSVPEQQAH